MLLELPEGFWFESVDSTQDAARRLIAEGKIQGTAFVAAGHQTDGRGTHGRVWSSPHDAGIYLSIVHLPPPDAVFETTTAYTQSAGVACVEALKHAVDLDIRLKPVNDLYHRGQKLGGILVESDLTAEGITALITGVGINVLHVDHTLDRSSVMPTSLEGLLPSETFVALDRDALIETLVAKICFWHGIVMAGQTETVVRHWNGYLINI